MLVEPSKESPSKSQGSAALEAHVRATREAHSSHLGLHGGGKRFTLGSKWLGKWEEDILKQKEWTSMVI